MAHNTKSILVDVNGKPIPQYFDPLADEYKPLLGQHGAARSMLYGPDGNPISDTNKLPVRAADLETLIGALNDSAVTNPANAASVIAALKGLLSVVGKEATLGQILSALAPLATESTLSSLASAVAKETTLAQVLSALGALATETTLGGVKTAVDVLAGTVDTQAGVQKVALSGRKTVIELLPPTAITEQMFAYTPWVQNTFTDWDVLVNNTLDVQVRIAVLGDPTPRYKTVEGALMDYNVTGAGTTTSFHVAPPKSGLVRVKDLDMTSEARKPIDPNFYRNYPTPRIRVGYRTFDAAPTEGSLAIYLIGG